MRFRTSNFPTPPREGTQRIPHPAFLLPRRESAVACLNAEHAVLRAWPLDPATESRIAPADAEVARWAPDRRPGEA